MEEYQAISGDEIKSDRLAIRQDSGGAQEGGGLVHKTTLPPLPASPRSRRSSGGYVPDIDMTHTGINGTPTSSMKKPESPTSSVKKPESPNSVSSRMSHNSSTSNAPGEGGSGPRSQEVHLGRDIASILHSAENCTPNNTVVNNTHTNGSTFQDDPDSSSNKKSGHQNSVSAHSVAQRESVSGSATSSVLARAKAGAAEREHRASSSPHREARVSSDTQQRHSRTATAPCTPSGEQSPMKKPFSPPVHSEDDEDSTDDEEDGDIFTKLSSAISKASSKSQSIIAGSKFHSNAGKSIPGKKSKKQKMNPRLRLVAIFLIFELVILGLGIWVAKTLEGAIYKIEVSSTGATLNAVQSLYLGKVTRMESGFGQMATESLFQIYAETQDPTLHDEINYRVVAEETIRELEFVTLMDADMKIIASANAPRDGVIFDPAGAVSTLQNFILMNYTQVAIGAVLSNAELQDELPPQWLERADASSPALFGLHPYDTGRNAFIRYVVTAVFSASDPKKVVGYLLSGDQINGKMAIPGNVYIALWGSSSPKVTDGFVGVYMSDDMTRDGWNVCDHATMATIKGLNSRAMSLDTDPVPRSLLDQALEANGEPVVSADKNTEFVFVARTAPKLSAKIPGDQGDPTIVLVQATQSINWARAFSRSMSRLAIVFAIDVFAIYMASCVFLGPLERLGNRIRKGKSLNMRTVEKLKHRKNLIIPILFIPLISAAMSIYSLEWADAYIQEARTSASVKKTSNVGIAYNSKVDQIRIQFSSLVKDSNIMSITAGNVTTDIYNSVDARLKYEQALATIEYVLLVDSASKVIYDVNGGIAVGTMFDPRGLVSTALSKSYPSVNSIILTHQEFLLGKVPQYTDAMYPTSPISNLHPYEQPDDDVLVRVVILPVTITDSVGGTEVVGALVAGDILNGMTLVPEKANDLLNQEGYSGVYLVPNFDQELGQTMSFQLVTSALRRHQTTYLVDLEVDGVQDMLLEVYNNPSAVATKTLEIKGDKHLVTARCGPQDYSYKPEGRLFHKAKTGAKCNILVVQSANGSATTYLAQRVTYVSLVLLLAQIAKLIVLMYLLYKAFIPFKRIILGKKKDTSTMKVKLQRVLNKVLRRSDVRVEPNPNPVRAEPNAKANIYKPAPTNDESSIMKAARVAATIANSGEKGENSASLHIDRSSRAGSSLLKGPASPQGGDKSRRQRPSAVSFTER